MINKDDMRLPEGATVAVGLSGGVDSATTVALLKSWGYKVIGLSLVLFNPDDSKGLYRKDKNFFSDIEKIAEYLEVEHHFLHLQETFSDNIIQDFADTYAIGQTPIPCVKCNREIKFGAMYDKAKELGADALATGHYIRWDLDNNGYGRIYRSLDPKRDQSYFLCQVRKEYLRYLRFPLGERTKDQTRALAKDLGLHVHDKPSSNSLCFSSSEGYIHTLKALNPEYFVEGEFVDLEGNVIGKHNGMVHYTVGQRRGTGVSGNAEPLYVVSLDSKNNRVVLGKKEDLHVNVINLRNLNLLGDYEANKEIDVYAKVRSLQPLGKAKLSFDANNNAKIVFEQSIFGVSPGQICAFYEENGKLIGGGYINPNPAA